MIENESEVYTRIKKDALAVGFVAADVVNWQESSYLVLALPYLPTKVEDHTVIARFACHDNYRIAVGLAKQLRKVIAPLMGVEPKTIDILCNSHQVNEKELALLAGIGFYGKNSLIIVDEWGSFVVLLAMRLPHYFASITHQKRVALKCEVCDLCQKACPSLALHKAYHLDRTLCLQSMASNGMLPVMNAPPVIYGCDICQNVCPYNRQALDRYRQLISQATSSAWCSRTLWEEGTLDDIEQAVARSPLKFRWLDKKALMLNARLRAWHRIFSIAHHKEKKQ